MGLGKPFVTGLLAYLLPVSLGVVLRSRPLLIPLLGRRTLLALTAPVGTEYLGAGVYPSMFRLVIGGLLRY